MSVAIAQANRLVSRKVCLEVGFRGDTARVLADRAAWNQLNDVDRAKLFDFLRSEWMALQDPGGNGAPGLEITDSAKTGFEVLAGDSGRR